jgi:hypothetical protein
VDPQKEFRRKLRQEASGAQDVISLIDCDGLNAISLDVFNEMALTFNMASMKDGLAIGTRERAPGVAEHIDAATLFVWVSEDCAGDAELCDRVLLALGAFVRADDARRENRIASVRSRARCRC